MARLKPALRWRRPLADMESVTHHIARSTRNRIKGWSAQSTPLKMIFLTRYAPRSVDAARRGGLCVVDRVCKRRQLLLARGTVAKRGRGASVAGATRGNCSPVLDGELALAAIGARSASGLRGSAANHRGLSRVHLPSERTYGSTCRYALYFGATMFAGVLLVARLRCKRRVLNLMKR